MKSKDKVEFPSQMICSYCGEEGFMHTHLEGEENRYYCWDCYDIKLGYKEGELNKKYYSYYGKKRRYK